MESDVGRHRCQDDHAIGVTCCRDQVGGGVHPAGTVRIYFATIDRNELDDGVGGATTSLTYRSL